MHARRTASFDAMDAELTPGRASALASLASSASSGALDKLPVGGMDIGPAEALSAEEQKAVMSLVSRNLLPVCWLSALLAYLDRANLSFAALQMNDDLGAHAQAQAHAQRRAGFERGVARRRTRAGFTPKVYGLGAGLFFCACVRAARIPQLLHR
jgi:hypothetical protein